MPKSRQRRISPPESSSSDRPGRRRFQQGVDHLHVFDSGRRGAKLHLIVNIADGSVFRLDQFSSGHDVGRTQLDTDPGIHVPL